MIARRHAGRGFTLVELLAVIAILVLLISLLMPALGKARELAQKAVCAFNFKNTGAAFLGYAADHEGRFPNKAVSRYENRTYGGSLGYPGGDSGPWLPIWQNLINREYFKRNDPAYYPSASDRWKDEPTCGPLIRFWTFWSPTIYKHEYLRTRYMACPSYRAWGYPVRLGGTASNEWSRPWVCNRMAVGGPDWKPDGYASYETFPGTLGKRVPFPDGANPNYTDYTLGTRMIAFANPNDQYLLWEAELGSDVLHTGSDGPNGGAVAINDSTDRPPWAANNGWFSFRHVLPPTRFLYQTQAQANVLYLSGRVETVRPSDALLLARRFLPNP